MMMLIMMTADENDNGDGRQECRWENNLITTKNLDGMLCNDSSVDDKKCGIISMYRSVTITLQLS
ncbi:Uncharacterized protein BM_BM9526 [Brugia malayi]|nr:Uncharacterized protein BM_BM9526 [Brugia malayi]VIO88758.1 Uncharacterized protein BM_BM9526 [Brugia malayi]